MVFFLLTGQGSSKQSPPLPRLPARGACTVPSPVGQWGYLEKVQQLSVGGAHQQVLPWRRHSPTFNLRKTKDQMHRRLR